MGWGDPHVRSAGTTGEIEEAHKALDKLHIKNGSLAVRALEAARLITRYDKATEVTITPSLTRSGVECELSPDLLALAREEIQRVNGIPDHDLIYGPEGARMLRNLPKENDGQ